MMLERQKVGIAKAKSDGKYKGRVPTARRREKDIQSLHLQGMKPSMIAKELKIGIASVYRYRNADYLDTLRSNKLEKVVR